MPASRLVTCKRPGVLRACRLAAVAIVLAPSVAAAQRGDALRVGAEAHLSQPRRPPMGGGSAVPSGRVIGAMVGYAIGAYVGVAAGEGLSRLSHGGEHRAAGLVGAGLGGMVGAAYGASVPRVESTCGRTRRFRHALAVSAVGTGVGLLGLLPKENWIAWLTVPAGSIVGATVGAEDCP